MWTTLALVTALTLPSMQGDGLALTNPRYTYGSYGPERPDNKCVPGDQLFLSFDIEGLKADDAGKVSYTMAMQVTNSANKVQFGQDPKPYEKYLSLGGNRAPAATFVNVGGNQEPGKYTINITVTDTTTKASQKITKDFEVLPRDFAISALNMRYPQGEPAPFGGVTGQLLVVSFVTVGFERDKTTKQPNLTIEMKIMDETGKAMQAKPFSGNVDKDIPAEVFAIPMEFFLDLNRAGKFTVELLATDKSTKKTSTLKFPLLVQERK